MVAIIFLEIDHLKLVPAHIMLWLENEKFILVPAEKVGRNKCINFLPINRASFGVAVSLCNEATGDLR